MPRDPSHDLALRRPGGGAQPLYKLGRRLRLGSGILSLWYLGLAVNTHGLRSWQVLVGAVALLIVVLLHNASSRVIRRAGLAYVLPSVIAGSAWLGWTGSHRHVNDWPWDLAALSLSGLIGALAVGYSTRVRRLPSLAVGLLLAVIAWGVASAADAVRTTPLPVEEERLNLLSGDVDAWGISVALSLSGGGYRAGLFHAGVLQALEDYRIAVRVMSAVSGGAIAGAFYAAGVAPATFRDAVAEGRLNLRRELALLHHVARLPLPLAVPGTGVNLLPFGAYDRLNVQEHLLRSQLPASAPVLSHMQLMTNASDLSYGVSFGISESGLVAHTPDNQMYFFRRDVGWRPVREFDLAARAAVSGAFPVAFPARAETWELVLARGRNVTRAVLLADGGIIDNSGLVLLSDTTFFERDSSSDPFVHSVGPEWDFDFIIESNAGAPFTVAQRPWGAQAAARAYEVTVAHAAPFEYERKRHLDGHSICPTCNFTAARWLFLGGDGNDGVPYVPGPSFNPARYSPAELVNVIRLLGLSPTLDALQSKFERDRLGQELRPGQLLLRANQEACDAGGDGVHASICSGLRLRAAVEAVLGDWLNLFASTGTLQAHFTVREACTIYQLGRFYVYSQWPTIRQKLLDAGAHLPNGRLPRSPTADESCLVVG